MFISCQQVVPELINNEKKSDGWEIIRELIDKWGLDNDFEKEKVMDKRSQGRGLRLTLCLDGGRYSNHLILDTWLDDT